LIGLVIGIGASYWLTKLFFGMLYGVTATDPITYTVVSVVLLGVAIAACYFPARWATKVDPLVALRHE
jgi:ABC-type lipoprotein release transport system permease subunit